MNKVTELCIRWIQEYFADNPEGKAIIGISGGKDSTIAAALCAKALGPERVVGVLMPNGKQSDIGDSVEVCNLLSIEHFIINIGEMYCDLRNRIMLVTHSEGVNNVFSTNTPARLRMATLYAVAALFSNSRVVNTCNRSEDYVGYSTKYGDAAGDFSPLGMLTVREVLEIGDDLGLPRHLVHKAPSDGMCGRTDEDNLGFTYEELDAFLLEGQVPADPEKAKRIMTLHLQSRHKYRPMPTFCWQDYDKDWTNI